jgi:hypothetical protein
MDEYITFKSLLKCLLFSILFLFSFSCQNNENHSNGLSKPNSSDSSKTDSTPVKIKNDVIAFPLEIFESVPDTIDGCGDYYTYDSIKLDDQRYLFLSNLVDFALIKVNGKLIYLKKLEAESKEDGEDHFVSVFEGNGYRIKLNARKVESYDEGGLYKGQLEITAPDFKAVIPVHGETGC